MTHLMDSLRAIRNPRGHRIEPTESAPGLVIDPYVMGLFDHERFEPDWHTLNCYDTEGALTCGHPEKHK